MLSLFYSKKREQNSGREEKQSYPSLLKMRIKNGPFRPYTKRRSFAIMKASKSYDKEYRANESFSYKLFVFSFLEIDGCGDKRRWGRLLSSQLTILEEGHT